MKNLTKQEKTFIVGCIFMAALEGYYLFDANEWADKIDNSDDNARSVFKKFFPDEIDKIISEYDKI